MIRVAVALLAGVALLGAAPRNRPAGAYEIVRVSALEDQVRALYRDNDPQLIGRIVTFHPRSATINDGSPACPTLQTETMLATPAATVRAALGPQRRPFDRDFGPALRAAGLTPARAVTTVRYTCRSRAGDDVRGNEWDDARALALSGSRWALLWRGEALAILEPRPRGSRVRASFHCVRARTAAERAICADIGLGGWDRSVASAFRAALDRSDGQQAEIRATQREWLTRRDACGSDVDCLRERMAERVGQLQR